MPRLFLSLPPDADSVTISGDKARYLTVVLRSKPGDVFTVVTPEEIECRLSITSVSQNEIAARVLSRMPAPAGPPVAIDLYQGILKGSRMDLVVQKSTELGVNAVIPLVTERSVVRETRKTERWRKIAEEASRQCRRSTIPAIHEPVRLSDLCRVPGRLAVPAIFFWEQEGITLRDALARVPGTARLTVITGPEGGFSEAEAAAAADCGAIVATLGRRILRAETAAIAAVSAIQFSLGNLG